MPNLGIPARILRGMVRPPLLVLLGLSTAALAVPIDRLGARSEREVSPRHAEDDLERRGSKMSHVPEMYRCLTPVAHCSSIPQKQKRLWNTSKKMNVCAEYFCAPFPAACAPPAHHRPPRA